MKPRKTSVVNSPINRIELCKRFGLAIERGIAVPSIRRGVRDLLARRRDETVETDRQNADAPVECASRPSEPPSRYSSRSFAVLRRVKAVFQMRSSEEANSVSPGIAGAASSAADFNGQCRPIEEAKQPENLPFSPIPEPGLVRSHHSFCVTTVSLTPPRRPISQGPPISPPHIHPDEATEQGQGEAVIAELLRRFPEFPI